MTIDDIISLTKAGFTKDDIFKLVGSNSASPVDSPSFSAPAQAQPESTSVSPAPVSEPEEKEDLGAIIEQKIGEAFKPFENLYNNIAIKANMPQIGNIEPRGVDDIINDFFTK